MCLTLWRVTFTATISFFCARTCTWSGAAMPRPPIPLKSRRSRPDIFPAAVKCGLVPKAGNQALEPAGPGILGAALQVSVPHFEGMDSRETHQRVHFGKWQHRCGAAGADTLLLQMGVAGLQGGGGAQTSGDGKQCDLEPQRRQFRCRKVRCAAALDHVGEQGGATKSLSDPTQFV